MVGLGLHPYTLASREGVSPADSSLYAIVRRFLTPAFRLEFVGPVFSMGFSPDAFV